MINATRRYVEDIFRIYFKNDLNDLNDLKTIFLKGELNFIFLFITLKTWNALAINF